MGCLPLVLRPSGVPCIHGYSRASMHPCRQCGMGAYMHECTHGHMVPARVPAPWVCILRLSFTGAISLCIYACMPTMRHPCTVAHVCGSVVASIHRCTCMHYCINGYIGASMHTCRLCWHLCIDALVCITVPMAKLVYLCIHADYVGIYAYMHLHASLYEWIH